MPCRRIRSNEDSTVDGAYDLAESAIWAGVSKKRFAEILNDAWDEARRRETESEMRTEITLG